MYTMIFDTETTDLNKCFCYNIGFTILDTDTMEIVLKEDYVVEQVWHNLPLFQSAYYADKRPIYVSRMKGKKASLRKFGQITRRMYQLIKDYGIEYAYAYNSKFDEKVFDYNCDWFKCINPFDLTSEDLYILKSHLQKILKTSVTLTKNTPTAVIILPPHKHFLDTSLTIQILKKNTRLSLIQLLKLKYFVNVSAEVANSAKPTRFTIQFLKSVKKRLQSLSAINTEQKQ